MPTIAPLPRAGARNAAHLRLGPTAEIDTGSVFVEISQVCTRRRRAEAPLLLVLTVALAPATLAASAPAVLATAAAGTAAAAAGIMLAAAGLRRSWS